MNNSFDHTNSPQLKSKNRHKHTLAYMLILTITKLSINNERQFASNSEIGNNTFFIFNNNNDNNNNTNLYWYKTKNTWIPKRDNK